MEGRPTAVPQVRPMIEPRRVADAKVISFQLDKIVIGERFRKDPGDVRRLAKSIEEVGLLHPVVVTPDCKLIAGVRRIEAFKLLGRSEIPATVVNLDDLARGEIEENQVRKDFTASEHVGILRAMEVRLPERVGRPKGNGANLAQFNGEKTRDIIASYVGVSHGTLFKEEKVVEAAEKNPEKFGKLLQKEAPRRSLKRAGSRGVNGMNAAQTRPSPIRAEPPHSLGSPEIRFVFSREAISPDGEEEYSAFCYDFICPNCDSRVIEIYVDRMISKGELWIVDDGEKAFRDYVSYKVELLVLHELCHWAGCHEDELQELAEII
jgi:hypothetical protein